MAQPIERKLAAILSADVVGYSRLMAEDEAATIRTLTDYREDIAMRVRQHRGRVVDTPGDNLLAEFPTALDAVRCAVEIQGCSERSTRASPTSAAWTSGSGSTWVTSLWRERGSTAMG